MAKVGGGDGLFLYALAGLLACGSAQASGLAVSEQSARAMGMAGAFGAQADDPSAVFWNPGGLAFQEERRFQFGITLLSVGEHAFRGATPAPGLSATGRQKHHVEPLPQLYWVEPISREWVFGLGLNSPFRLDTGWEDPDAWPGRFIAEKASLRVLDLNPSLAWRASERLGLSVGLVLRASELDLRRREAVVNPSTLLDQEAARVELESDLETSVGWSAGLLYRVGRRWSWGASYRSAIELDYAGRTGLTQVVSGDAVFDAVAAATFPFGREVPFETSIDFPDWLNLAAAWQATPTVLLEFDVNRTGWDVLDGTDVIVRAAPRLNRTLVSDWDDADTFRLGVRWSGQSNSEWRVGLYFDESPQPEEELDPLLADADRVGYSLGYGTDVGGVEAEFAVVYIDFDPRATATNRDGFNGSYENRGWILATSFAW